MRRLGLGLLLLAGCGGSVFQVGDPGRCHQGSPMPLCCQGGCQGTSLAAPVCQDATWVCPQGSAASISCPESPPFCSGADAGS